MYENCILLGCEVLLKYKWQQKKIFLFLYSNLFSIFTPKKLISLLHDLKTNPISSTKTISFKLSKIAYS